MYTLHSYVSHDQFLAKKHKPSRNGNKSPEDDVRLPMRRVIMIYFFKGRRRNPLTLWNAFVNVQLLALSDLQSVQLEL